MSPDELTVAHDRLSAIRFLENLYHEIEQAKALEEIRDTAVLLKLAKVIEFIQQEFQVGAGSRGQAGVVA